MGRWGLPINLLATAWSLFTVLNVGWPRAEVYGFSMSSSLVTAQRYMKLFVYWPVALRPDLATGDMIRQLSTPRGKQSFSNFLRKTIRLSPVAIGLLQEAAMASGVALSSLAPPNLAALMNAVPLQLNGTTPIARAISTAGGISFDELDADFMIRRLPGTFAAGEMLDWEAPTGGYLLQAAFATGAAAARGVLKWPMLCRHG